MWDGVSLNHDPDVSWGGRLSRRVEKKAPRGEFHYAHYPSIWWQSRRCWRWRRTAVQWCSIVTVEGYLRKDTADWMYMAQWLAQSSTLGLCRSLIRMNAKERESPACATCKNFAVSARKTSRVKVYSYPAASGELLEWPPHVSHTCSLSEPIM